MDAADALRNWRLVVAGDISLLKASRILDCDPAQISKIENRLQRPGLALAGRIEKKTGIKMGRWADVDVKPAKSKRAAA